MGTFRTVQDGRREDTPSNQPFQGAPGFVQFVSHVLGLKPQRPPGRVARQRELLSIAASEEQRDRVAFTTIRGRGETHGDHGLL